MYEIAWSWTCSGIPMVTVGLDVGTGRGGMTRPASCVAGAALATAAALADAGPGDEVEADADDAAGAAFGSAGGPPLSQATMRAKPTRER
jgi:hypothetical protein